MSYIPTPSHEDQSVNFIKTISPSKMIETRFVRRTPDYFIAYLSSQTGCKQACRFCHLTATGQVQDDNVSLNDILEQADTILTYHLSLEQKSPLVHFNFMARGEPLANPHLTSPDNYQRMSILLHSLARSYGLESKIKISSIIPLDALAHTGNLDHILEDPRTELYYSLYSVSEAFRKRWIPRGAALHDVGEALKDRHEQIVLHHAFIKGENDSKEDIKGILTWLEDYNIKARFNVVRYNPYSDKQGSEANECVIEKLDKEMRASAQIIGGRIVPRVGYDVKASCGMFMV